MVGVAVANGAHGDPIGPVVLALALILVLAKVGGHLAARLGQPAVLGELLAGVLLGNLGLIGLGALDFMRSDPSIDLLAKTGVLLLLFEVGLESTVAQMLKVGLSALLVAVLGVTAPFVLGWLVGAWLVPEAGSYVHAFLGATLCATSVGITARVLKDLKRSQTTESRIILGAAVVDDVLGLIILAIVAGVIGAADRGGAVEFGDIAAILLKSAVFLVGGVALGHFIAPRLFHVASKLQSQGVLVAAGLGVCFGAAGLANLAGLAPIIGAFAAGLVLESVHYRDFVDRGEHPLEDLIHPITAFLVPIFFVVMGMRTDLRSFADPNVLGLAAALTVAAIAGKQLCSLGVRGRGIDRLTVGIGMVPRGEVGLIFANIGLTLTIAGTAVISSSTYSALVVMVIVTTMVTPPALKWAIARHARRE